MEEPRLPTEQDYARAAALLTPLAHGRRGCRVCGAMEVDLGHALFHAQRGEGPTDRRTRDGEVTG
jgi:hypothetical protein